MAISLTPDEQRVESVIDHLSKARDDLKEISISYHAEYLRTVEFILQEIQYISNQKKEHK